MKPTPWTTSELAIVRELYPAGGAKAVRRLLPSRSVHAIRIFACNNDIRCEARGRLGRVLRDAGLRHEGTSGCRPIGAPRADNDPSGELHRPDGNDTTR